MEFTWFVATLPNRIGINWIHQTLPGWVICPQTLSLSFGPYGRNTVSYYGHACAARLAPYFLFPAPGWQCHTPNSECTSWHLCTSFVEISSLCAKWGPPWNMGPNAQHVFCLDDGVALLVRLRICIFIDQEFECSAFPLTFRVDSLFVKLLLFCYHFNLYAATESCLPSPPLLFNSCVSFFHFLYQAILVDSWECTSPICEWFFIGSNNQAWWCHWSHPRGPHHERWSSRQKRSVLHPFCYVCFSILLIIDVSSQLIYVSLHSK